MKRAKTHVAYMLVIRGNNGLRVQLYCTIAHLALCKA